ncbi:hypothetical protein WA556_002265, partial [Blastocystis sp. ATCC 50177/Nand II]
MSEDSSDLPVGFIVSDDDGDESVGLDDDDDFDEGDVKESRKRASPKKADEAKSPKKSKKTPATEGKKTAVKKPKEKAAPKKELTESEGYDVILKYLNEQNKPFNAQTIFDNLHKEVKKPYVVRILSKLAQEGKIIEKEYGKSKVYFADQNQFPSVSDQELKEMDNEINALTAESSSLQEELTRLRNEVKELSSSLTDEDLEKGIATMTEETKQMKERVEKLKGSETIDPKELESLRTEVTRVQKIWRQRRNQCREMVGNLAEGMDKKDSEVNEMVGLETEEE